jgi:hypothetical protein
MLRLDIRIIFAGREALGFGQRLLKFGGQLIEPHVELSQSDRNGG